MTEGDGQSPSAANRFAAPRTRLSDTDSVTPRRWSIAAVALFLLAGLWWLDVPRNQIFALVATVMIYPDHPTLLTKWSTLFAERLVIESLVCVPAAALLTWTLPTFMTLAAAALVLEEWVRSVPNLLHPPSPSHFTYSVMALALHSLLLIGFTAWLASRRRANG